MSMIYNNDYNQEQLLITEKSLFNLSKLDNRIQDLFNVQVSIPTTANNEGKLVSLCGPEDNVRRAKEYIQAVCHPECTKEVFLGHAFKEFFNNSSLTNQIQVAFGVSMTAIAEGTRVRVCGREDSVAKATGKIYSIIQQDTVRSSRVSLQDGRTSEQDLWERMDKLSVSGYPQEQQQPCVSASNNASSDRKIVEELLRLGYPRDAISNAMQSAGPQASYNQVLTRITRIARSPVVARTPVERASVEMPSPQHTQPPPVLPPSRVTRPSNGLRPIVVDGSNVAISHGSGQHSNPVFSCRGISIVVEYFKRRGHEQIYVMVPMWRKEQPGPANNITDQLKLKELDQQGHVKYTPSRTVNSRRVAAYDDYYIVELAHKLEGIIVSNDNYRDVAADHPQWKETIDKRLLMFTFVEDMFMPPEDPMGRHGPRLNEFLKLAPTHNYLQECPHGKKCTFGRHCKYSHSDRDHTPKKVCPKGANCTFGDVCKFYHPERDSPQPSHPPGVGEMEKRASSDSLVGKDHGSRPQSPVPYTRAPTPSGYSAHQMTSTYPPPHAPSSNYSSSQGTYHNSDLHLSLVPRTAIGSDSFYEPCSTRPRPTFPPRSLSSPYLEYNHRVPYSSQAVYQQQSTGYNYPQVPTPPYPSLGHPSMGGFPQPAPSDNRELFKWLVAIMSGYEDVVQQVLNEHPNEKDLTRLVSLCRARAWHSS